MFPAKYPIEQTDPPRSPKETLPTMYDLPSEDPQQLDLTEPKILMPTLELGLGLWSGVYQGIERQWLRWYDVRGNWIPTDVGREQRRAEQAESLLAQERQRAEQLAERLRALGLNP